MHLPPPLFVSEDGSRIPPPTIDVSDARELGLTDHREGVSGWEHIKLRDRAAIPLEMLSGGGFPQSRAWVYVVWRNDPEGTNKEVREVSRGREKSPKQVTLREKGTQFQWGPSEKQGGTSSALYPWNQGGWGISPVSPICVTDSWPQSTKHPLPHLWVVCTNSLVSSCDGYKQRPL